MGRENFDPNYPDIDNLTPLRWATAKGHEEAAKLLLEWENVYPNRAIKHDITPLMCAAAEGREGGVKTLLERENVDCNRTTKYNITSLGWLVLREMKGLSNCC